MSTPPKTNRPAYLIVESTNKVDLQGKMNEARGYKPILIHNHPTAQGTVWVILEDTMARGPEHLPIKE